jgi:outer membrane protein assembly factor BamB
MKNKIICILILTLLIAATILPVAGTMNNNSPTIIVESKKCSMTDWWPMFHHDPEHTGYSTCPAPNTDNIAWDKGTGGGYTKTSPAVIDNYVYVGIRESMYCFTTYGSDVWDSPALLNITSSPAVANGKVYAAAEEGLLYCWDATSGTQLWYDWLGNTFNWSSPVVYDNKVYISAIGISGDGLIWCVDANNGDWIWNFPIDYGSSSSPAVVNDRLYIGTPDYLYCLNAIDGQLIWNTALESSISSPTIVSGRVYIGSDDGNLYCLNSATGAILWQYPTYNYIYCTPAVANGYVYFGSYDNSFYCLDISGNHEWDEYIGDSIFSSPAVADGKVYFGSNDDYIYCLDASNGNLIWDYDSGNPVESSPAIVDGDMYILTYDQLYCFGTENDPPELPDITGRANGETGKTYEFTFSAFDPNDDDLYIIVDWGDGSGDEEGPIGSGEECTMSHSWAERGEYIIRAKARDIHEAESDWAEFTFTAPRNKATLTSPLLNQLINLLQRHPNLFPILQKVIEQLGL